MRSQPHDAQAVPAHGSLVISYATKTDHQFDVQFHRSHALAKTGDNLVRPLPRRARLARVAKSFRKRWGLGLASNEFNWTLDTGFGLPWKSLFEMALPYNLVQQKVTDIAAGAATTGIKSLQQLARRSDVRSGRNFCSRERLDFPICSAGSPTKSSPDLITATRSHYPATAVISPSR